jgi:TonB family protein
MRGKSSPIFCLRGALLSIIFLAGTSFVWAQETSSFAVPETQIQEVASRILKNADKVNCKPGGCKIVVADFTLPSGLTSQLGIQLANQLSKQLASQQSGIEVIDRSVLQAYLQKQRIPPDLLANDKALRWLGKQLGSTAVLMGKTQPKTSLVQVKVSLLSSNKEKGGPTEEFTFPLPESKNALSGFDPITRLVFEDKLSSTSTPYRAGVGGVTQPACEYCPDPNYAKAALEASFNGTVLMDVLLSAEGQASQVTILRGAPFGLNEEAISAVRRWRFKPATLNGKPVPVKVTVEIGMRFLEGAPLRP